MLTVQKFGGTSIGNSKRLFQAAEIIKKESYLSKNLIVVVSAINPISKMKGTTNLLLGSASQAIQDKDFSPNLNLVAEFHNSLVKKIILNSSSRRKECLNYIESSLSKIKKFLEALKIIKEIPSRASDQILQVGEQLSAYILSTFLKDRGFSSAFVDLSKILDEKDNFEDSSKNYDYLKKKIHAILSQLFIKDEKVIPVVTGFIGKFKLGILEEIGRGYTDYTASLIGSSMKAKEIQIWKEVDGMLSSDPKIVAPEKVRLIENISPDEALELSSISPELVHPFSIKQIKNSEIPIRIKNTFNPKKVGTLISKKNKDFKSNFVEGIAVCENLQILHIQSSKMIGLQGLKFEIIKILENYQIPTYIMLTSDTTLSICTNIYKGNNSKEILKKLYEIGKVKIDENRSLIGLVGENIKHYNTDIFSRIFGILKLGNIDVDMISLSASQINISCVIKEKFTIKAANLLHDEFFNQEFKSEKSKKDLMEKILELKKKTDLQKFHMLMKNNNYLSIH